MAPGGTWGIPSGHTAVHKSRSEAALACGLGLVMASGALPGYLFGLIAPLLRTEFALSSAQIGLLTTTAFAVGAIGSLSFAVLLAGVALAGIPLASVNPSTNQSIPPQLPTGRRGFVMGIKQAGVQFGAFGVGALVTPAAVIWGWRGAMLALLTEVDRGQAGRASGLVLLGFYGGFIPSPLIFGAIVDATGSYLPAWSMVGIALTCSNGMPVSSSATPRSECRINQC